MLTRQIEKALSKTFAYQARVVVRSFEQIKAIVDRAPKGFGVRPAAYRYDVIFLKDPLTADEAMKSMTAKPGVDRVFAGDGVLYFSRLISKAAQSYSEPRRRQAGVPEHDDPQLEHDRQTSRADGAHPKRRVSAAYAPRVVAKQSAAHRANAAPRRSSAAICRFRGWALDVEEEEQMKPGARPQ